MKTIVVQEPDNVLSVKRNRQRVPGTLHPDVQVLIMHARATHVQDMTNDFRETMTKQLSGLQVRKHQPMRSAEYVQYLNSKGARGRAGEDRDSRGGTAVWKERESIDTLPHCKLGQ